MRIELNLVPASVLRRREQANRRRAVVGVPVLIVAGVAGLYGLLLVQEQQAKDAARDAESRLEGVRSRAVRVSQLQAEIAEFEQGRRALVALAGRPQPRLYPLLGEVSRLIPRDVWLQSLTVEAGGMILTGNALQLRSVAVFAATLAESAFFDQIKVQNLQQIAAGRRAITQFQITLRLKRLGP